MPTLPISSPQSPIASISMYILIFLFIGLCLGVTMGKLDGNFFHHDDFDRDFRYWKVINRPRNNFILFNNVWTAHRMHDGYPIFFHNKNRTHKAMICMYPKGGSTTLKFLLRHGIMGTTSPLSQILTENPHSQTYHGGGVRDFKFALADGSIPRFLIVRNPYIRFLSAYLNKIVLEQDVNFMPPGYNINQTFNDFIDRTIEYQSQHNASRWYDFNNHFTLMSKTCGLDAGMTYDYILPLEQMDYWYEPLIRALGIVEETKTGWNVTTKYYKGDPNSPCFYRVKDKTCDDMFTDKESHPTTSDGASGSKRGGGQGEDSDGIHLDGRSKHSTNSATQLAKYLNSPLNINKLTHWMMQDLIEFRYPLWDGNDPEEYVKSLFKRSSPPTLHYDGRQTMFLKDMKDL